MPILTWVFLGLIAGFIGSKIVNRTGEGLLLDIVLGIVGSVVGGWLFNAFGHPGVSGVNLYSIMVAVVGAIVVLVVYHAMIGGRRRIA
ncbi:MAG: GlsB/YeaQ/YmgE family stress response membrane protein [Candidatus Acidiferrum sp.]